MKLLEFDIKLDALVSSSKKGFRVIREKPTGYYFNRNALETIIILSGDTVFYKIDVYDTTNITYTSIKPSLKIIDNMSCKDVIDALSKDFKEPKEENITTSGFVLKKYDKMPTRSKDKLYDRLLHIFSKYIQEYKTHKEYIDREIFEISESIINTYTGHVRFYIDETNIMPQKRPEIISVEDYYDNESEWVIYTIVYAIIEHCNSGYKMKEKKVNKDACHICGETKHKMYKDGDVNICKYCISLDYTKEKHLLCGRCSSVEKITDMKTEHGVKVCKSCYKRNKQFCRYCGKRIYMEDNPIIITKPYKYHYCNSECLSNQNERDVENKRISDSWEEAYRKGYVIK